MDFMVLYSKEILALLGGITSLVALIFTFYAKIKDVKIKEQELKLKITLDKQKELFSNKIETYQQLYPFCILFYSEDYQIERLTEDNEYDEEEEGNITYQGVRKLEEYEIKMKFIDDIFTIIENNIFYVSNELEGIYGDLYQYYNSSFNDYYNGHINNYCGSAKKDEYDFNSARKKFYDEHKEKIKKMVDLIRGDFLDLRTKYFYEN